MKIHVLQHVAFEGPAGIDIWANENRYSIEKTFLFQNQALPDFNQFDLLVVMGGPMNIYEEKEFPWLTLEKRFIETAIKKGKSVLGICLGAQLIADVLGGSVTKNREKEIGWYDVEVTSDSNKSELFKNLPPKFNAFHWHGDTFQIPRSAIQLARSVACENQAFEYSGRVLGLQFHLESTKESIEKLMQNCGDEIVAAQFVQSQEQIRSGYQNIKTMNSLMSNILKLFARNTK